MKKSILTSAMLIASMALSAQGITTTPISLQAQYEALGMSSNHRYITGLNVASFNSFVWDTETGKVTEHESTYVNSDFRSVTNDGKAFGNLGLDDMVTTNASTFDMNGTITTLDNDMSQVFDVTPDGTLAVGCLLNEMWYPTACFWKNGERTILLVPSEDECGFQHDGANAQYVSDDGKVIVGYLQDWHSSRPAIVWRLQSDGTYKADVISKDIWELNYGEGKPYLEFSPLGVSPNGKWICLASKREAGDDMPTREFISRMNLETGEIFDAEEPDDLNADDYFYPSSIADDGTCVGVIRNDEYVSIHGIIWYVDAKTPKLLSEVFPQIKEMKAYDETLNYPIAISGDASYIAGYGYPFSEVEGEWDFNFQSYLLCTGATDGIATITTATLPSRKYNTLGQSVAKHADKGIIIAHGRKYIAPRR